MKISLKRPQWILSTVVLLSTLLILVKGKSYEDAPPVITEVSPAKIGDPTSYIHIAKSAVNAYNVLVCKARNADNVFWKYKARRDDEVSTTLPAVMEQKGIVKTDNNRLLSRTLTDENFARDDRRPELNGFYQCFAESNFIGNRYLSLTPLIQILYANIREVERIGPEDAVTLYRGVTPTVGKPYKLPCIRDPSLGMGGHELIPDNAADVPQAGVTFKWEIRTTGTNDLEGILTSSAYAGRVRVDPRTGDLYIAVLEAADAARQGSRLYQCSVLIGDQDPVTTNQLYLSVAASTEPRTALVVQYPLTSTEKTVICVEKTECKLAAIFGGTASINASPEVVQPDGSSVQLTTELYGVSFSEGTTENSGDWVFKMVNPADQSEMAVTLKVYVLAYPVLPPGATNNENGDFPKERTAFSGDTVTYVCNPSHVDSPNAKVNFFINGEEVKQGSPSYVTYDPSQPKMFSIANVQRNQSVTIACVATNDAGTMFEQAKLTVFDSPVAELDPKEPYQVKTVNDTGGLYFNCSFKLDGKTDFDSVQLRWRTNHTKLQDKAMADEDEDIANGISSIDTTRYSLDTSTIESRLGLLVDAQTQALLEDTAWWCVCNYTVLRSKPLSSKTNPGLLQIIADTTTKEPVVQPFQYTWVIVGAVLGLLFLILLIVLINCYVQKNKGEQYYVDRNERKAGHNPDEEMKAYGYVDYNRPDQNPVKGSRASMNFSERPLESDHGSMDEYGDIDTGRFNEDGSFIGEYRGQSNHRNQADV